MYGRPLPSSSSERGRRLCSCYSLVQSRWSCLFLKECVCVDVQSWSVCVCVCVCRDCILLCSSSLTDPHLRRLSSSSHLPTNHRCSHISGFFFFFLICIFFFNVCPRFHLLLFISDTDFCSCASHLLKFSHQPACYQGGYQLIVHPESVVR